jgi:hypothetical protein
MAAFSSFRFFESGALSQRPPATCTPRAARHRTTDLTEIAARVRATAGEAAVFLWAVFAVGCFLLVLVGFLL